MLNSAKLLLAVSTVSRDELGHIQWHRICVFRRYKSLLAENSELAKEVLHGQLDGHIDRCSTLVPVSPV